MLFSKIIAVYFENHKKHKNILCGLSVEVLYVKANGIYSNHLALKS
jgi:hypothetical protein